MQPRDQYALRGTHTHRDGNASALAIQLHVRTHGNGALVDDYCDERALPLGSPERAFVRAA